MYISRNFHKKYFVTYTLMLLSAIFFVSLTSSCSHRQTTSAILKDTFNLANVGKYDEAQLKALEAEEQFTDMTSLED